MWQKLLAWINSHPYIQGLLVAVEGALIGALVTVLSDYATGNYILSKDGLKKMGVFVVGAVVIAVRNYLKQAPRQVWTPEERAAKLNGKVDGAQAGQ